MKVALAQTASIVVVVFAVSSMLSVGLSYDVRTLLAPLRRVRLGLPTLARRSSPEPV